MRFFAEFCRAPKVTGAVAPSSRALAELIVERAGVPSAESVVELGPGTGAFTRLIRDRLRPGARFLAVERNPVFAGTLRERFPDVRIIDGCASRLRDLLAPEGVRCADAVVSGLPWAAFDARTQASILGEVRAALGESGTFATFAYFGPHLLAAGRSFRAILGDHFENVTRSRVVLGNLPPAFVYACRAA